MYLNQISLTGGIPFSVSLPKAPVSIHADVMTTEEIHQKLEKGYNDIEAGRVQNAAEAFRPGIAAGFRLAGGGRINRGFNEGAVKMAVYEFDGEKYKQASRHQKEWGNNLISQLHLSGTETVLDFYMAVVHAVKRTI